MKLFCTAGRGTESFAEKEISDTFQEQIESVHTTDGKLFFNVKESCTDIGLRILKLATVERLFVLVISKDNTTRKGKRELLTLLHTELDKRSIWENAIETFYKLKGINNNFTKASGQDGIATRLEPYDASNVTVSDPVLCTQISYCEVTKDSIEMDQDLSEQKGNIYVKRKREASVLEEDKSSRQKKVCLNKDVSVPHRPVEVVHKEADTYEDEITYRISCKFTGSVRHKLNSKLSSKQMGVLLAKLMGWRVDLKEPKIEICIHLNDEALIVGIPVFREPLSKRGYIKHNGLRSTVCRIMTQLAQIQPGDVVLDPMFGKATILLEATHICKTAHYLGIDIDEGQLALATENIDYGHTQQLVHIIQGNALNLSLLDSSVDKVITDAPFGQNHKIDNLYHFYIQMFCQVSRVLKPEGLMVLLTSEEMKDFILRHLTSTGNLTTGDKVTKSKQDESTAVVVVKGIEHCNEHHENSIAETCHQKSGLACSVHSESFSSISTVDLNQDCDLNKGHGHNSHKSHVLTSLSDCIQSDVCEDNDKIHVDKTENASAGPMFYDSNSTSKYEETGLRNSHDLVTDIEKLKLMFVINSCNYIKLGSTDSYLFVLKNIKES